MTITPLRARLAQRLRAVGKALFPSVPPADQARVLAAMEGRDCQAPAAHPLRHREDRS